MHAGRSFRPSSGSEQGIRSRCGSLDLGLGSTRCTRFEVRFCYVIAYCCQDCRPRTMSSSMSSMSTSMGIRRVPIASNMLSACPMVLVWDGG